jgi:hypothetical protein
MPLFKYCKRQHFEWLQRSGSLRIGTLSEYRNTEQYGTQIGDADEGGFPISGTRRMPAGSSLPGGGVRFEGEATATMTGCYVWLPHDRDRYLFCVSSVYDEDTHRRLKADPQAQYDACYRINDPGPFFGSISRAIADRAQLLGVCFVQYRDGVVDFASPLAYVPPELVKNRDGYAHLQEVRGVWRPLGPPVAPFPIDVREARRFCELVATI